MKQTADDFQIQTTCGLLTVKALFFGVVVLAFVCFLPGVQNALLDWDDKGYIINNEHIRSLSFDTVRWAFTEFYCNYWAPLTWLSLAVDYAFTGLNPSGYHITNNILHACNAGFFFLIVHQYLELHQTNMPEQSGRFSHLQMLCCAALSAVLFAVHPLRVESVVWATERKDVQSLFFGLLAVLSYIQHIRDDRRTVPETEGRFPFVGSTFYWLGMLLYLLSLLSKAMLISLPVVLIILDRFPSGRMKYRSLSALVIEKIPLLIMAGIVLSITMRATTITSKSFAEINLLTRVLTAFKALATYVWLILWPVSISPVYLHPGNITAVGFEHIAAILFVCALTGAACLLYRRYPVVPYMWLLFLLMIFPVLGLEQNGPQEMAARFTYMPGLPLAVLAALGLTKLLARYAGSKISTAVIWCGIAAVMIFFVLVTYRDISYWKNDINLWTRVIELQPHRFGKAYFQRALFREIEGNYAGALADINEALEIAVRKKYAALHEIYVQRARVYRSMKEFNLALADYDRAIAGAGSDAVSVRMYRGERGEIYRSLGESERSRLDLDAAGFGSGGN